MLFGFLGWNCQKCSIIPNWLAIAVYLTGSMWSLNLYTFTKIFPSIYRGEAYSFCPFLNSILEEIYFLMSTFFLLSSCIMDAYVCEMSPLFMHWPCTEFRHQRGLYFLPQIPRLLLWYVTHILSTSHNNGLCQNLDTFSELCTGGININDGCSWSLGHHRVLLVKARTTW